ncbi:solute carrier family 22 member 4-like isoform X1 [Periophthalmus magnuspinnatus]|uniref:solute carrier family 22 member 4-like isoform X1 n=1 Tax=Periophthalmus magnuspinnatus TaxID=409849 RepID=UPI002436BF91|nr:solute carrier family 22 member 4-like isoform X1 [Periophthalmus magnuspinnatus]
MPDKKEKDFDDVTLFLGDYGPFQITLIFLLSLFIIPNGYMGVVFVFVSDTPDFHCKVNEKWNLNSSYVQDFTFTERSSSVGPDGCSRYKERLNSSQVSPSNDTEACADGWDFSKDIYTATIVSEWELVCDNAWKVPFSSSLYFVGVLTGSFVCGNLSDRIGRKPVLFLTMAMQCITALIQAASVNWGMFTMLSCLRGFGLTSCYTTSLILGSEILSPKPRMAYNLLGQSVGFGLGYALLPLFGYFIRDWRMLLVACAIPGLLVMPLWWVVPESPRWLLQKNRLKEAEAVIRKAAKMNQVSTPDIIFPSKECLDQMKSNRDERNSYTCLDLLRTSNIRIITLMGIFMWFTCILVFSGLSLNTSNLNGNKYLNCFISAVIDIAAYIMTWVMVSRMSRPIFVFSSMMFCGILLLIIQLVPDDMDTVFQALALSGRFGISAAYSIMFVFFIELMPTVVRNTGLGIFSTTGRIGSILCPYIIYLGVYNKGTPYIVFGSMSIVASVLTLFLPDTRNNKLPELISQVQPVHRHCCPNKGTSAHSPNLRAGKWRRAPSVDKQRHHFTGGSIC